MATIKAGTVEVKMGKTTTTIKFFGNQNTTKQDLNQDLARLSFSKIDQIKKNYHILNEKGSLKSIYQIKFKNKIG